MKDAIIVHSIEGSFLMEELKKYRQKMYTASATLSIDSFFLIAMLLR